MVMKESSENIEYILVQVHCSDSTSLTMLRVRTVSQIIHLTESQHSSMRHPSRSPAKNRKASRQHVVVISIVVWILFSTDCITGIKKYSIDHFY